MSLSVIFTILALAFALSMDAFAVSVSNGLYYRDIDPIRNALSSATAFGFFQGLMPLAGYFIGSMFHHLIESVDHWVALLLLCLIGGRMIYGAVRDMRNPGKAESPVFSGKALLLQAVATSIDALAVGVGLTAFGANIYLSVLTIGVITFICSFCGVLVGNRFGGVLGEKATLLGGILLMGIGVRIFCDHLDHIFL